MTRVDPVHFVLPEAERYNPQVGGAIATVTREVAASMIDQGTHVVVLTPTDPHRPYSVGEVVVLSRTGTLGVMRRAWFALARRVSPRFTSRSRYVSSVLNSLQDAQARRVVVANDPDLALRVAELLPLAGVLLWLHNFPTAREGEILAQLPSTVRIVTVSAAVRDRIAAECAVPSAAITVIHNGVNPSTFHPGPPRGAGEPVRIVCHGRIDPNKGQVLAANAVRVVRDRVRIKLEFTVIGAPQTFGFDTEVVASYVNRLDDAVAKVGGRFTGRVPADQVGDILRDSDIACVLPTVPDPFPLAGLEALASGCALVAIPLGGVDEMVGDAAVRVEATVESVAAAIEALALNSDLRHDYQRRAVERARMFRWDAAASAALALLDGSVGRHDD